MVAVHWMSILFRPISGAVTNPASAPLLKSSSGEAVVNDYIMKAAFNCVLYTVIIGIVFELRDGPGLPVSSYRA